MFLLSVSGFCIRRTGAINREISLKLMFNSLVFGHLRVHVCEMQKMTLGLIVQAPGRNMDMFRYTTKKELKKLEKVQKAFNERNVTF